MVLFQKEFARELQVKGTVTAEVSLLPVGLHDCCLRHSCHWQKWLVQLCGGKRPSWIARAPQSVGWQGYLACGDSLFRGDGPDEAIHWGAAEHGKGPVVSADWWQEEDMPEGCAKKACPRTAKGGQACVVGAQRWQPAKRSVGLFSEDQSDGEAGVGHASLSVGVKVWKKERRVQRYLSHPKAEQLMSTGWCAKKLSQRSAALLS